MYLSGCKLRADFPRQPTGMLNRHITDEANARLRYYIPGLPEPQLPPEAPPKPQLPPNTVDAPLVRVFNFLRGFYFTLLSSKKP